ncbi:MAG: beta-ketoacyl synthase chain length factor [Burkholderiaceae bacterium]
MSSLDDLLALRRNGPGADACALPLPSPQALPANERRRASQVVRLTLACAEQALQGSPFPVDQLRLVFASDEGTGEVCQQMLEALAVGRELSPLVFHNSVHNAPSGYFCIGHQNRQSALSVSLGKESFASGLLCAAAEAQTTGQPVIFLAYDAPMPPPLHCLLPIDQASATAWIIAATAARSNGRMPLASFALDLREATPGSVDALPSWLPASWAGNSSAPGFVALTLLDDSTGAYGLCLGTQCLRLERRSGDLPC